MVLGGWPQGRTRKQVSQASDHELERALWPALKES